MLCRECYSKEDLYKLAATTFGKPAQTLKTIEECSELSAKLSKYLNNGRDKPVSAKAVAEEVAGVSIMLEQLLHSGIPECPGSELYKLVNNYKEEKLNRLYKMLNKYTIW